MKPLLQNECWNKQKGIDKFYNKYNSISDSNKLIAKMPQINQRIAEHKLLKSWTRIQLILPELGILFHSGVHTMGYINGGTEQRHAGLFTLPTLLLYILDTQNNRNRSARDHPQLCNDQIHQL